MSPEGKHGRGGINRELGTNTHTLIDVRQITKKAVLHSRGNSMQYSMIIYMRKES